MVASRQRDGPSGPGARARRRLLSLLGGSSLGGFVSILSAQPAPVLTWVLVDWPPLFLIDPARPPRGPAELGDGVVDRAMAELIARLPGFLHRFELMSRVRLQRALADQDAAEGLCYPALLRTPEREQRYVLLPWALLPPPVLALRAGLELPGPPERPASLAELQAQTEWRGALEANRSYGGQLDRALAGLRPLPRESVSQPGQLCRLVARGRYDYTLEYPLTLEHLRRSGQLGGELRVRSLVEAQEWPVVHIACPRSPGGRAAAQAIGRAVAEAARGPALRSAMLAWLPQALQVQARPRVSAFYEALARGLPPPEGG
ncbi:UNVERIFIED_ORG: hypothetical protein LHJ69_06555 [Shinella sp. XGS7]|nr:hypothetical protein [Shinella sp. XGS7]